MNRGRRVLKLVTLVALFLLLVYLRAFDVSRTFRMLGDQARDWRIALGPFTSLPLVGTPSTAGGTTLGPIFYWVLWSIRVLLGPFFDNLPHAGGVGLSIIQSATDVLLFHALSARLRSVTLALAIVLFAATSPYDMVLSATIWNPPLAVALIKATLAAAMLRWPTVVVVALAWLAVQAHTTALFVAVPVIAWLVIADLTRRGARAAVATALMAAAIILTLQVPYLVQHLRMPLATGHSRAITSPVAHAMANPGSLRLRDSLHALGTATAFLLFAPREAPWAGPLLAACAVLIAGRLWRQPDLLALMVAPLVITVFAVAMWRGAGFGQSYWYLTVMPCAAATIALGITALAGARLRPAIAALLLALVVVLIPSRAAWAREYVPLREYQALVRASRLIVRHQPQVRAIEAPFLPPTTDPAFIYEILGGRITADAPLVAVLTPAGDVSYRRAAP